MARSEGVAATSGVFALNGLARPKQRFVCLRTAEKRVPAESGHFSRSEVLGNPLPRQRSIPRGSDSALVLHRIDFLPTGIDNFSMSTETVTDLELICAALAEGRPVEPELARRAQARAEQVRRETFERQGLVNVSDLTARE